MTDIYPNYYKDFACIGSRCRHNCCIGWEIDIDSGTFEKYMAQTGELGERLRKHCQSTPVPHFVCGDGGRCPFLNCDNLCDIIIELGEDSLCSICDAHPRFTNELSERLEHGLGLCCEEAARLILGQREVVSFITYGDDTGDDVTALRDRLLSEFQDRSVSVDERCDNALRLCGIRLPDRSIAEWAEYLLSLERLDQEWSRMLETLATPVDQGGKEAFRRHISSHEYLWEQLLVYLIWRHCALSPDTEDVPYRCAFAVLSYRLIFEIAERIFVLKGDLTFEDTCELCRMYSAEIEYSPDNTDSVLDELYFFCSAD